MRSGEASTTARRVAAQRLTFTREPADYGRPADDNAMQADVAAGTPASTSMMTPYLQGRTTFFDKVVVGSVERGITQIVIVGAGYDGRALRYAKPSVSWFELDHPDTQADKRERLERLAIDTSNISFAAADFATDDVAAALHDAGQDPERVSLFICEGVIGYLGLDVTRRLLAALASRAAPGSPLAVTIPLEPETITERVRRRGLGAAVARMGEPLQFSLPRAELPGLLAEVGWELGETTRVGVTARRARR